jgi:hypothetical protein
MNDTDSSTSNSDLGQQVAALQRQVFLLLVALIVVAATFVFHLYYQSRIDSKDLEGLRPSAKLAIDEYSRNALAIQNFEKQLVGYGMTHPSFQPILRQYGLMASPANPAQPAP